MILNERQIDNLNKRRVYLEEKYPQWTERTLAGHFKIICQEYTDRPLLMMPDAVYSYAEIWQRAEKIVKALINMGVKKGDHLAVLMMNDPDFIALWIASSMVGSVLVPLNTQLKRHELDYMIRQSDTDWLILHQYAGKQNQAENIQWIYENLKNEKNARLKNVVCIPNQNKEIPSMFKTWDSFMKKGKTVEKNVLAKRFSEAQNPHDTAAILYTSGSTGLPKGVMLSHDMMLRSGFATCFTRVYEDGRRIYAPLPLYHVYFVQEGLLAVSFVGGAMISSLGFAPLESLELMEKYQANDFLAVPSMLVSILNQNRLKEFDLEPLTALLCCAAPSPVPLWERTVRELGVSEIGTGCGGTEASSTTMLTEIGDPLEIVSTRVGKVKTAGVAGEKHLGKFSVEYKVIDPDTGEDLPDGSVGELVVRGNVVSKGYYNKPEETAFTIDAEGWSRSGDIGRIDEQGYIQLLGRSKNLYKVSGETVAPKEVEDVISLHPAVTQVYIVGVSDRFTTETGAAFVELKEGMESTENEIRNWCKDKVAKFKVPRYVWFVKPNEWPLTATGKIQKFKLREIAEEKIKKQ